MTRIQILDLPHLQDLTPEQLKELFGAGKFRPELMELERRMMPAAIGSFAPILSTAPTTLALAPVQVAPIQLNEGARTSS